MYGCKSWTSKKAEHWRIDDFELWCWRRLESPLHCKEIQPVHPNGNQSWILIGRTDAEAETPILGHLMRKTDSLEKTLTLGVKAGGEGDDWGWDCCMTSLTQWTWVSISSWRWWWTAKPGVLQSIESQRVRHNLGTELNWTEPQRLCEQRIDCTEHIATELRSVTSDPLLLSEIWSIDLIKCSSNFSSTASNCHQLPLG